MKTYVRVEKGIVWEVIPPMIYDIDSPPEAEFLFKAGDEVPIEHRFPAPMIDGTLSLMIDVTSLSPQPEQGWTYDGTTFLPSA